MLRGVAGGVWGGCACVCLAIALWDDFVIWCSLVVFSVLRALLWSGYGCDSLSGSDFGCLVQYCGSGFRLFLNGVSGWFWCFGCGVSSCVLGVYGC